ncbi:hypothetical protein GOP47_0000359 [Adiantum capillus-veneris]|uniref:Uncharacterized protein n=1 Tax=Adiantum capillus-veneris TaxID=13818 RepID=A0A9D4ZT04_ADICA|nr:hypothetical protein GOP47_0000359 [Adiantum capillus-veneris]
MGRCRRFKKRSPLCRGRVSSIERALDAETLRETIGMALYDRVMQWNDSGAAEALQVAEQRRKAKEIKRPCWVPKLNDELYIGTVDWNTKESGEACSMPKSAVAFADETFGERCSTLMPSLPRESEQRKESCPALGLYDSPISAIRVSGFVEYEQAVLEGSIDTPLMVEAVLEHCADGLRLLVGGWPVEPSGWDEVNSQCADGPCIVEAVLEDFGDGQRLLVGGWPIQPSWDELDTNWSQLGWDGHSVKVPTCAKEPKCWDPHIDRFSKGHINCFSGQQLGWQGSWYPGNASNSLHQRPHFMTAF